MLNNIFSLGYNVGKGIRELMSLPPPVYSVGEALGLIRQAPYLYGQWWLNLVLRDPVHVAVETLLILSVIYMMVSQSRKDWREEGKAKLSPSEQEELLRIWKYKERKGLVPEEDDSVAKIVPTEDIPVVEKMNGRIMVVRPTESSPAQTVLNFATFDFLGMSASTPPPEPPSVQPVTPEKPRPFEFLRKNSTTSPPEKTPSGKSYPATEDKVEDSLDIAPGDLVKEVSRETLKEYGCGACGPRGFYGTIDVHLDLEKAMKEFTGTDGAILYSDGASTVSSAIAAFAKRGDLLVVDSGVSEPILTGVTLSRANIKWFEHNDMDDLRRVLEKVQATDKALGRKSNDQRRFIVIEGLYKNWGTIAKLDELVKLKEEFHYRMVMDESFSFGTLGDNGRGVIELMNKKYMHHVEVVSFSLENALGSIGGICVGNEEVVDHQRLSGAGYCFSAASPPFTASAAMSALQQMQDHPQLLKRLKSNQAYLYKTLAKSLPSPMVITSDERSPLVFVGFSDSSVVKDPLSTVETVAKESLKNGVAVVATGGHVKGHVHAVPPPAIRMTVSAAHTTTDIDNAVNVLCTTLKKRLSK